MKRYEMWANIEGFVEHQETSDGRWAEHKEAALDVAAEREKWQTLNDQYMALKGEHEKLKSSQPPMKCPTCGAPNTACEACGNDYGNT